MNTVSKMLEHKNTPFTSIIGRSIESYWLTSQGDLVLQMQDGDKHLFSIESDCCSESWFYAVDFRNILGNPINAVYEPLTMMSSEDDGLCKQDSDSIYGYLFGAAGVHPRGFVEFRNSSNGHYGGWVSYGGLTEQEPTPPSFYFARPDRDYKGTASYLCHCAMGFPDGWENWGYGDRYLFRFTDTESLAAVAFSDWLEEKEYTCRHNIQKLMSQRKIHDVSQDD